MYRFEAPDFYNIDGLLTDEQRMTRDTVRSFVGQEVMPHIKQWFSTDQFPVELVPALGELGLLGASLDGYGCADLGGIGYGLINQELERGDSGLRSFVSVQTGVTSELVFEDCRIPAANLLPGTTAGLKCPLMCLNQARYSIAWGAVGAASACFDEARQYSLERTQFGKPIAAFQITQQKLADMLTAITQAQLLV